MLMVARYIDYAVESVAAKYGFEVDGEYCHLNARNVYGRFAPPELDSSPARGPDCAYGVEPLFYDGAEPPRPAVFDTSPADWPGRTRRRLRSIRPRLALKLR
jgi:hypothetical protein